MLQHFHWDSTELKSRYANEFGIDVDEFLEGDQVTLSRDEQSGVLMFKGGAPGDGAFYEELAKNSYYYTKDKWEFSEALRILSDQPRDTRILEIGCGSGEFLEMCRESGFENVSGIEFNERALSLCRQKGLDVTDQRIEDIAASDERYDFVCAFQVLEHVPDPVGFLRDASQALSKGGKLIVCTPNAGSFLCRFQWNLLDLPPHHMSRWDESSYQKMTELLGLDLNEIRLEPLARYHYKFFAASMVEHLPKKSVKRRLGKLAARAGFALYPWKRSIPGHSMMVVISRPAVGSNRQIAPKAA